MAERCVACGKPITTIRRPGVGITLQRVWVHYSRWANRSHHAIPEERYLRPHHGEASDDD